MTPAQLSVLRTYVDECARAWTILLAATWSLPIAIAQQAPKPKPAPVSDYRPEVL